MGETRASARHRRADRTGGADRHLPLAAAPVGLRARAGDWARSAVDEMVADWMAGARFLWATVAFALGAAGCFALPAEPMMPALALVKLVAAGLCRMRRRAGHEAAALLLLAVLTAGATLAAIEARRVAAPRLDQSRTVTVSGWIVDAEWTAKGGRRFVIEVRSMTARGLFPNDVPRRIAVTAGGQGRDLTIGTGVTFLARLSPPDGPTLPGGYDFARRAWFDGRGASGFVLGRMSVAEIGPAPLTARLTAPIDRLREAIATRIRASVGGETGAIAVALTVGEARAIPEDANQALRVSGLYHIISISGLHMSLVAGGVMFVLRLALALTPAFASRHDSRKIAAVAAVLAATGYLVISGAAVATVRSWIMFCVALLAVLTDRPAINLRTVAISALLILAVDPSSVVEPGFQMSFLAVIALVAGFEGWTGGTGAHAPAGGRWHRALRWLWGVVGGSLATSLLAGLATAPIVIAEFHRGAPYGILANLLTLPVVGLLIMPMVVATFVAMPFGLEHLPLAAMGRGIEMMMAVARWTAELPGAAGLVGRIHPQSVLLAIMALMWLAIWRGRARWLGLPMAAGALALAPMVTPPDIIAADDGRTVAVRTGDRLAIIGAKDNRFAVATWLLADREERAATDAALASQWTCDGLGCAIGVNPPDAPADAPDAMVAVHVRDAHALLEDCTEGTIIVTALAVPDWCRARAGMVLDRDDLRRGGTTTISGLHSGDIVITPSLPPSDRPWTPRRPPPPAPATAADSAGPTPDETSSDQREDEPAP